MRIPPMVIAAASLAVAGAAQAQGGGARVHEGLSLHADVGFGWIQSSADGADVELSGVGPQLSITVGKMVVPNLVLGAQLWGSIADSPDLKVGGVTAGTGEALAQSGIGLSVTYHFVPWNAFVSATPSLGGLSMREKRFFDLENGFALRLAAGKEWWVGDAWGLGVSVHLARGWNDAEGAGAPTWRTTSAGLALSATYD